MKKNKDKKALVMEDVPKNTKDTMGRLWKYLAKQKGKLIVVTIAAIISCASFAAIPLVMGMALDRLVDALKTGAPVGKALSTPVLLILLTSAVSALFSLIQQYVVASVGEETTLAMRREISTKLNRLPLSYFDAHQPGEVMSRVTNDLEKVSQVIQTGMMQLISSGFTILIACVVMITLNLPLFLITLLTVVVCLVATAFVARFSQRCYARNMAAMGALTSKIEEVCAGNRVIRSFSRQEPVINEVAKLGQTQFEANRLAQFADNAIYPTIRFLNQLGFVAIAVVGGVITLSGGLTLGIAQAFLQYFNQISEPVTQMAYVITAFQAAIAGAERVFSLLDEEEEWEIGRVIPETAHSRRTVSKSAAPKTAKGQVSFQNVRFGYTPDRILMKDLTLTVNPNEMVAIVGPTGGGKTTLVNLIMRFYELNGGSISIDGVNIAAMPRQELRRKIGMVLQDTWLFEGTIAENISYGKRGASMEEIETAAKAARCDHFIRTLPKGYDTMVSGEEAVLSQGQTQLLTIARAMLTNPAILILDEATSSVDTRTEVEIQRAMARLMQGKTSFVIAHRLSTIVGADRILVVRDGDIIEQGNHESLLKEQGFYASLYRSQFEAGA